MNSLIYPAKMPSSAWQLKSDSLNECDCCLAPLICP